MRILVTAGATREPIDEVRFISNLSSGRTGAGLAEALAEEGHELTVLHGRGAVAPGRGIVREAFDSTEDLLERLRARVSAGTTDAVVMSAAVADYRPAEIASGKLSSQPEELHVRMVRTPKILPLIKGWSPRPVGVVGFKLTVGADPAERKAAVRALFAAGGVDRVVHNDLVEIRSAPEHPFWMYGGLDDAPALCVGVRGLAEALLGWLAESPW
jgi:phosphopantothenoylcysteine decarboxylase/phosphopantothenate--cysteine ligase